MRAIGEARGASVDFGGAEAIAALSHRDYDVVVFPGGSAVQQFNSIGNGAVASVGFARFSQFFRQGAQGWSQVRRFVDDGKGVLGLCAGAMLMTDGKLCEPLIDAPFNAKLAKGYGADLRGTVSGNMLGGGGDDDAPIAMLWHNGPFWAPPFALPAGVTAVCSVESFESPSAKKSLTAKFKRKSCIVQQGRCVAVGPHPECTAGLEDLTWSLVMRCAKTADDRQPASDTADDDQI